MNPIEILPAFYVQYHFRKDWRKTYFGNKHNPDSGLFYFETLEETKQEIKRHHEYQKERNKKLTKYRIVETHTQRTTHDIL